MLMETDIPQAKAGYIQVARLYFEKVSDSEVPQRIQMNTSDQGHVKAWEDHIQNWTS